MATRFDRTKPPLIVIAGPTASGKTSLAVDLAERLGGEIICADSRTVYKEMDIGTAKPSREDRERVPHWGLDLVKPDETFTVSDFKTYADLKIAEIKRRGNIPLLVGGTGLYIDAVVFDFQFGGSADEKLRTLLNTMSTEELLEYCNKYNIKVPENSKNKRHLVRAIERAGQAPHKQQVPTAGIIYLGIVADKATIYQRIRSRTEQLFSQPVVEEAKIVGEKYGWQHESMSGNIYPLIRSYLEGSESLSGLKQTFMSQDRKLAKRQLTWFRRNPYIVWLTLEDVDEYINDVLPTQ